MISLAMLYLTMEMRR